MDSRYVHLSVMILAVCILSVGCAPAGADDGRPIVTEDNYPKALYFRQAEAAGRYPSYEAWEGSFDDLMGFVAQALPYQLSDHPMGYFEKNTEYFTRFKKDNPDHIILLHLNTNDQDPRLPGEDFHAGHWLYFEGAKIVADVPAEAGPTEIQVSDTSVFSTNVGLSRQRTDHIGLCMLDAEGKPDWNRSEQMVLVSIDPDRSTITVERGRFRTEPLAFPADRAYAAAHVPHGPWVEPSLQWQYNYAVGSPRDEQGRSCSDMVVTYLTGIMAPDGPLPNIDGVALDVMYNRPDMRPNRGADRLPDYDADGVGDDPRIDNRYSVGMIEFLKDLKQAFGPNRFVVVDGYLLINQRAFGAINGSESEGWPDRQDWNVDNWSGGINNMMFWYSNSVPPKLSYMNHAYGRVDYAKIGAHHARLVIAASTLTNSIYVLSKAGPPGTPATVLDFEPDPADDYGDIWDELVMGVERKLGWLGKPLGPAVRMAALQEDELEGHGAPPDESLLRRLSGRGVSFDLEDGAFKVACDASEIRFQLDDVPCDGPDLTVIVTARGEPKRGYPPEYARLMVVSADKPGLPLPGLEQRLIEELNRFVSYVNYKDFTSAFYFSNLAGDTVDLEFTVEGPEPVWITGIEAYCHPDAMYREFDHGLVLANPSEDPYEFDLAELVPDREYKRLQGSPQQDPKTNDGSPVTGRVRLQGKDALFLVKVR